MSEPVINEGWEDVQLKHENEEESEEILDNDEEISETEISNSKEFEDEIIEDINDDNDIDKYQTPQESHHRKDKRGKSYHFLVLCFALILISIGFYLYHKANGKVNTYRRSSCSNSIEVLPDVKQVPSDMVNSVKSHSKIFHVFSSTVAYVLSKAQQKRSNATTVKKILMSNVPRLSVNVTGTLRETDMSSNETNISEMLQRTKDANNVRPTKFTKAREVVTWKALAWNYTNMINYFGYLDQVLRLPADDDSNRPMKQRVFVASNDVDLQDIYPEHILLSEGILNLPFREFLHKLSLSDDGEKYFFSGNYRIIEELAHLREDTSWEILRLSEESVPKEKITIKNPDPQLTLMYPNTALQARRSEYHTVRVQLSGTGKYYVVDPMYGRVLHPYPSTHSAASQSQIDFYSRDLNKFPLSKYVEAEVVVLNPGDILYVPPYVTVHSEAYTNGNQTLVSFLDVLSPSIEQLIISEVNYLQTNFSLLEGDEKITMCQLFLVHVISRLKGIPDPQQYVSDLYESRYASLYHKDSLPARKLDGQIKCKIDDVVLISKVLAK